MEANQLTIRLPIPPDNLFTLGILFGAAAVILICSWLISNWPYRRQYDALPKLQERFGANVIAYLAIPFVPIWFILVLLTIDGVFELWFLPAPDGEGNELASRVHYLALVGLMGALAALLATPLGLYRVFTTERQTTAAEEGLITDRINKAVEGLGALKVEERIGRPVTVLSGEPTNMTYWVAAGEEFELPLRSALVGTEYNVPEYMENKDDVEIVDKYETTTWPEKKTEIEWRNENLEIKPTDKVESEGDWQVFKQTLPNLEVRIGAIYSLERIAQDSLRDHIQIMEILCAYIRENAKSSNLEPSRKLPTRPIPREDIQTVITVLGRRDARQKSMEFKQRYRLDLRRTDLSGVNFSNGYFLGTMFHDCRLEACIFNKTNLEGTQFYRALLDFAFFWKSNLRGTRFDRSRYQTRNSVGSPTPRGNEDAIFINGADFSGALISPYLTRIFGTRDTKLEGAKIDFDKLDSAKLNLMIGEPDVSRTELKESRDWLQSVPYRYWSPFTVDDGANHELEDEFREYHSLDQWPHVED